MTPRPSPTAGIEDIVRSFPLILDNLQRSYKDLETRAVRVEEELCRTNEELEARLRELDDVKRHLEAVLDSLPTGVVVRDSEGVIVRANGAAQRILGAAEGELVSKRGHLGLQGDRADSEPHEVVFGDGREAVLASCWSSVRLADGTLSGSVEILQDLTDRTRLAERLHAADKMAALGTLAAGIAHEIRNPLNAVKGFASLLRRKARGEEVERWCSRIVDGTSEADAIIENMLSFGSPERLRIERIDPTELLASAAAAALPDGAGRDGLRLELDARAPAFLGDRIKLRQAIRNLLANAAEAQGGKGPLKVLLDLDEDEIVVTVSDSGPGIPPAIRSKILDPFFTTRAEGTGLGLALVSTIARLHAGRVVVHSEPSPLGGAEISLHLPYQPAPSADHDPQT